VNTASLLIIAIIQQLVGRLDGITVIRKTFRLMHPNAPLTKTGTKTTWLEGWITEDELEFPVRISGCIDIHLSQTQTWSVARWTTT